MLNAFYILLMIASAGALEQQKDPRPAFKDYPVKQVYKGVAVPPKLNQNQHMFRTRIREGAKRKVQFAGHYTVPAWGYGAGCVYFVIVDSITGKVYDGFSILEMPASWTEKHGELERIEFHPDSRLLRVNGYINEENCGFYDYEMAEGQGLKLLRKELLPKEYQ